MDGVVSEGLATVFERDFGGREAPWGKYPEGVEDWVTELLELPVSAPYNQWCSGSMIPDTNVGGKIATISEVSDDQKTTFLYS